MKAPPTISPHPAVRQASPAMNASQPKRAFTIIELLVAMTVTIIISGVMIAVVSNLLNIYNRSSGRLTAGSQASLFFEQITADLESAVFRNTSDVMMAVDIRNSFPSGESGEKPTGGESTQMAPGTYPNALNDIEDMRFGGGGAWFRFFTTSPDIFVDDSDPNEIRGAVRAVAYQIDYRPVTGVSGASGVPRQFMLFRSEVGPEDTFEHGYEITDGFFDNALDAPDIEDVIVPNVVDFGVRVLTRNADGNLEVVFPSTNDDFEYLGVGRGDPDQPYPHAIEVMIRVLTPEGERLIRAIDDEVITDDWWEVAEQHSVVFSRLIRIPSRPL